MRAQTVPSGSQIADTDWSMSLGYSVHVLTDNPDAEPAHYMETDKLHDLMEACAPGTGKCSGLSVDMWEHRQYLIIVRSSEAGVKVFDGRMIELIAHECSHIVDYVALNTRALICTETRAYTLDWLVGKCVRAVLPHLWSPKKLGHTTGDPSKGEYEGTNP